jgi:hypothetical protein
LSGSNGRGGKGWEGSVCEGSCWAWGLGGGAGVILSILPTCSGAAVEPPSVRFPGAGAVTWHACLRVVLVGGADRP